MFNAAHTHLLVNHFPIILPFIGVFIVILGLIFKSELVQRIGLLLFILTGIAAFVSMNTGENAEHFLERLDESKEHIMHEHEEAAETFAVMAYILSIISLVAIYLSWTKKKLSKIMIGIAILAAFILLYFSKETGTSGGEITHLEIRNEK
jgi:uncharacterized membrane protein